MALAAAGCGKPKNTAPPVATPSVTLNHDRVATGSPLEITYKFVVASDAKFDEDFRVFAHVLDTDEEQMWTDDHMPPKPTSQWKPGDTIEYTRTIFVPAFPYVGDASLVVGLHSTKDQHRLPLSGQDAGQLSYRVATLQILPQTDNLFTVFKDGWQSAETSTNDAFIEWQWTKKVGTLAFKNPKKDAIFYLDLDSPSKELHDAQKVQIVMGGETLAELTVTPDARELHKITLPARLMGDADLSELQLVVDHTFQPSVVTNGASKDTRELGVRVFHAFVDPR
ncbi:MAG: hypothetical protein LBQ09_01165 [Acidobacteriaceae bacterium]|nr:hypothetical protein [Acidobacteriaceae bacterium]